MHRPPVRRVLPLLLVLLLVVAAIAYLNQVSRAESGPLRASGTVEAVEVDIAAEVGGRVVSVLVAEGDPVTAGQDLVRLDDALLQQQLAAAKAARDAAQANLDLLLAGPTEAQRRAADEAVAQAEANLDVVESRIEDAEAMGAAGQALLRQLEPQRTATEAALRLAEAQRDQLLDGARPEQVAAAQAQVDATQAQLQALELQIERLTIRSPIDGTVLARAVEPGEVALPGATLLVLGDLSDLTITVYLPEDRYGQVSLGQRVRIQVDSFPGEVFSGSVLRIADRAEFTPRNVGTAEGRRTTVFAVRLRVEDPGRRLKPGMPADVVFSEE